MIGTVVVADGPCGTYEAEILDDFDMGMPTGLPFGLAVRQDGSLVLLRPYLYPLQDGTTHFESIHNEFTPPEVIA